MMVEDHPFDYKDFEGIIPKGNYGAGTVMVWDEGTYEPLEDTKWDKSRLKTNSLLKELRGGSLKFRLNGKKLKGEFALVQTRGRGDNSWLLIKHRDKYASEEPVTDKDKSVLSKKTLEQIADNPRSKKWASNRKTGDDPKPATKASSKTASKASSKAPSKTATKKTIKTAKPMLDPNSETQTVKIAGHELTFNHLSKVFWPKEKIHQTRPAQLLFADSSLYPALPEGQAAVVEPPPPMASPGPASIRRM